MAAAAVVFAVQSQAIGAQSAQTQVAILTLGTSLTANYQWPQELAELLAERYGPGTQVENKARAGATSRHALEQFNTRRTLNPDIVLVEFVANDADWLDGLNLGASRANHMALIASIREKSPRSKVVLVIMGPVFGLRGAIRPRLTDYYAMYRQLAASNDVALIDLSLSWERLLAEADSKDLFPDGIHPQQSAASQVVLPALRRKIDELVNSRR